MSEIYEKGERPEFDESQNDIPFLPDLGIERFLTDFLRVPLSAVDFGRKIVTLLRTPEAQERTQGLVKAIGDGFRTLTDEVPRIR